MVLTMKVARGAGMVGAELMRQLFAECASRAEVGDVRGDCAEIIPGVEPGWYVVITDPGRDVFAAEQLCARRFGIYQPEVSCNGRIERMFPGYVFVTVWGIDQHAARLETCPGVARILRRTDGEPARLTDQQINRIQVEELWPIVRRAQRNWRKRKKGGELNPEIPEGFVRIRTKGYFGGISALDPEVRIGVLHKALGLS